MDKRDPKLIDKYPDFHGSKETMRLSGTISLRRRDPTNSQTASKVPNYCFDHSKQMPVWPDRRPDALIENTQGVDFKSYRTMNASGRPYALGVDVGGAPDDPGHPFVKSGKTRIIK